MRAGNIWMEYSKFCAQSSLTIYSSNCKQANIENVPWQRREREECICFTDDPFYPAIESCTAFKKLDNAH